jgi:PUA domain protein
MFKKFDPSHDVSTSTPVKSSVQRALKAQLLEHHPSLTEDLLAELLPKKQPLVQYKVGPHMMLYCRKFQDENKDHPVLFQHRDGPLLPTLKLVHMYTTLEFTSVTVDRGAIPYLLGGANVMCPGVTNPGGSMPDELERGRGVVIYAQDKEYAIGVGVMMMSAQEVYVLLLYLYICIVQCLVL